ncbi:MAG TPA: class I SAM-dependent rRNA methyltransferase [Blastocatellia bacterium]|nr:class I SAM-dependent rRNA methyltransferase [Blastocatellia bacterium]
MTTTITISKRGAERVRGRHLWIYRSDVSDATKAQGGEVVRVADPRGRVLGRALYSSRSQISLRMVAFEDVETDRAFWLARLEAAESLRQQVVRDTNAYRLVYGESDLLPSLVVDRFDDCFVVQTLSQGMETLKPMWLELLIERYGPRAIIERNEARVRDLEGLSRTVGVLYGADPGELTIEENGVRFSVNLLEGQKTGAFLDQRENRIAAESYGRGRALDCFTFHGGFALHLARSAERVTAVDISAAAIEQARHNAALNQATNVECIEANVFDYLRELEAGGERFDVINLDPPAFAKNRGAVDAAMRGYKEINLRAMKLLARGGTLITSTCSYHLSEEAFLNVVADATADAGRVVQIVEKRAQARDHPVLVAMPETYYLKCFILRVT